MTDLIRLVPRILADDRDVIPFPPLQSPVQSEAPRRVVPSALEDRDGFAGHLPPGLALLRGLPDEWAQPPDRMPSAPRSWRRSLSWRGALFLGALVWICAAWTAIGAAVWVLHWIFGG